MTIRLQPIGLRLLEGRGTLVYDEAAQLLLQITSSSILIHSLAQPQQAPREAKLSEGPAVATAKVSLDGKMMALQRSPGHLQFMDLSSTKTFVQGAWKGKSAVLGFFWTSSPECSFVMVTKLGVETYQLQPNKQGLRLASQYAQAVSWWQYSHAARVLLLGAGIWIQAYQFTSEGVIRLPPFQESSGAPSARAGGPAQARLDPGAISVQTLSSKVYCAVLDRPGRRLALYRFYKDAVLMQHQYELPSASVQLAVSDDLLLVYHVRSGQAMVIDVCAEGPPSGRVDIAFAPPAGSQGAKDAGDERTRLRKLRFELPNVLIDTSTQEVLESRVDVEHMARDSKDWPATIGFLLRRDPALYSADLPRLALSLMKDAMVERSSMETVRRVCDTINAHQASSRASRRGQPAKKVVLTPQEVCKEVFAWMHDEEAVDAQYLQAAIVEYRASACAFGVELPLMQQILAFDVALQLGHADQVAAEVAWGHEKDCKELATQLEAWPQLPHAAELANGMRARSEDHEQRCKALLGRGKVLEAVRVMQRHKLRHLMTAELLDLASKQGDVAAFTAVFRACHPELPAQQPDFQASLEKLQRTAVPS